MGAGTGLDYFGAIVEPIYTGVLPRLLGFSFRTGGI